MIHAVCCENDITSDCQVASNLRFELWRCCDRSLHLTDRKFIHEHAHSRACHDGPCRPQWQRRRARVLLASQKARWELLESNNAGFTVSESCTLGWLNVILRHLWPTVIEKEVAEATTKQIQARGLRTAKHAPCTQRQHALLHYSADMQCNCSPLKLDSNIWLGCASIWSMVLQESIEKLLFEGRNKAPLKYIESIKLEEFTLGLVPPRFHSCHA
jgi:hypothetical protein